MIDLDKIKGKKVAYVDWGTVELVTPTGRYLQYKDTRLIECKTGFFSKSFLPESCLKEINEDSIHKG